MFSVYRTINVAFKGFSSPNYIGRSNFHSSKPRFGLDEFFTNQSPGKTGRAWHARELRLKSFEDLQKLWFVLLKEKNMLYTYKNLCRQNNIVVLNPERFRKVRKSMAAIKQVVGERSRIYKEYINDRNYFRKMQKVRKLRAIERVSRNKKISSKLLCKPNPGRRISPRVRSVRNATTKTESSSE